MGATECVLWLEKGSVNASEIECNCVNANLAIAQTWLSECCVNAEACIPHGCKCGGSWRCLDIEAPGTSVQNFIDTC